MPGEHSVTKWRLVSCHKTCLPGFRWGNHYPIDSLPATLFSHALPRPLCTSAALNRARRYLRAPLGRHDAGMKIISNCPSTVVVSLVLPRPQEPARWSRYLPPQWLRRVTEIRGSPSGSEPLAREDGLCALCLRRANDVHALPREIVIRPRPPPLVHPSRYICNLWTRLRSPRTRPTAELAPELVLVLELRAASCRTHRLTPSPGAVPHASSIGDPAVMALAGLKQVAAPPDVSTHVCGCTLRSFG